LIGSVFFFLNRESEVLISQSYVINEMVRYKETNFLCWY
jgi:hypothetical protein